MGVKGVECKYWNLIFVKINLFIHLLIGGIFGEVFLYSLRKCLGDEIYNTNASNGWTKIYSRILATVIPHVVVYELKNKDAASKILDKRSSMHQSAIGNQSANMEQNSIFQEDTKRSLAQQAATTY